MCDNITKFFDLLEAAGAVTVDDGAMLTDWDTAELTGEPGSQVVHFSWTDGEHSYSDSLTEGGIAKGVFDSDGKFVAEKRGLRWSQLERKSFEHEHNI